MNKTTFAVIAISLGLASLPAFAVDSPQTDQQATASMPKTEKLANLGKEGKTCKNGKCGSHKQSMGMGGMGGMGDCCCSNMMSQKMGKMGEHDGMDMDHADQGTDLSALTERLRMLEERMEMMQKTMMEQKAKG